MKSSKCDGDRLVLLAIIVIEFIFVGQLKSKSLKSFLDGRLKTLKSKSLNSFLDGRLRLP